MRANCIAVMETRLAGLAVLAAALYLLSADGSSAIGAASSALIWLAVWYFTGGGKWIHLFRNTAYRDFKYVFVRAITTSTY